MRFSIKTKVASIGYQVVKAGSIPVEKHVITSWDMGLVKKPVINGTSIEVTSVWQV